MQCPVADGGDGTLGTVLAAGFERIPVYAKGRRARWCRLRTPAAGKTAVVEMARNLWPATASRWRAGSDDGLQSWPQGGGCAGARSRMPRHHHRRRGQREHRWGCGLSHRARRNSCAISTARASIHRGAPSAAPRSLTSVGCTPRSLPPHSLSAVDVDNPLYGPLGAAGVYAPQKGANPGPSDRAGPRSFACWADVVERETKTDYRTAAGAGAAGGVGFAALAVLRAQMQPGIDVILDRVELDRHLQSACAVVTGEGSLDRQSLRGQGRGRGMSACQRLRHTDVRRRGRVGAGPGRSPRRRLRRRLRAQRPGDRTVHAQ